MMVPAESFARRLPMDWLHTADGGTWRWATGPKDTDGFGMQGDMEDLDSLRSAPVGCVRHGDPIRERPN